ncbi:MAG: zinc ribbon domain-containing protein, partial [Verrucomicrobiota bacterium]|nr:zinc ribbon domain-containing protein [Verrucomicrobiota bacterium]
MTTITATPKLLCPECRRENEAERIYCHDCGAKLDRASLRKVMPKVEDASATRRRLNSMFDPRRQKLRQGFFVFCKVMLGALAIAGVVQMLRAPDEPEPKVTTAELPAQINLDLENAAMEARPTPLRYSEEQVNAYLAYVFKSKHAALSRFLQFDRGFVGLDENACRFTVERSFSGVKLFTTASFTPQIQNHLVTAKVHGGWIGRMPIHPLLMQYGEILFADVRTVMERDR